jgi:ribonuclease E
VALYEEPDVLVKVIRDLFNEDYSGLIVSGDDAWKTIDDYVQAVAPELAPRMTKYEPASPDGPDVFAVHRIDEQLTKAMDRKVWLPSGGTLVIDRTEAMTVVDVNTGKFTGSGGNLEQTVTKNNIEAAEETVRQLRLRDIGGIIVIDFIDMVLESNRDLVLRRLNEALSRDRTRHQVSEVTSLGLVQLTRKKLGTGLIEAFSTTCTHCGGRGIMLHGDPVDSAPSANRKAEPSSRRGKRGKKGARADDVQVAKVPAHASGEHPMFKAMAAAVRPEGEDDELDEDVTDVSDDADGQDAEHGVEPATGLVTDESDTESEDDDVELDEDDDEDVDDDIEVIDRESDDDSDDDDSDDEDDEDEDEDDDDDEDIDDEDDDIDDDDEDDDDDDDEDEDDDVPEPQVAAVRVGRPRRRAAARPAGPPAGVD